MKHELICRENIEIALATDQGYFPGLAVTVFSIALRANKSAFLNFTILDGGVIDRNYECLVRRVKLCNPNVEFRRFRIENDMFLDFPSWRGNKMAYARFLLPQLLPQAKHVIYCDVDFLWLADIGKLWQECDDKVILQAVHDPQIHLIHDHKKLYARLGLDYDDTKYFCSGLLLMNLTLFRKENAVEKIYSFLKKTPQVMFPDQDALNFVLGDKTRLLGEDWMRFSKFIVDSDFDRPIVCHYAGEAPWVYGGMMNEVKSTFLIWHRLYSYYQNKKIPMRMKVLYHCTRCGITKSILYLVLSAIGKSKYVEKLKLRGSLIINGI